ncbi:Ribosomal RNA small subunit methyltransferase E [Zhongshania aliphaticivorans]|uniref:Ribosomal RNA small subunit methyltransferase E n=1 Tax=Zhongshania aliphaticivorans TaxID=1470434 RepID=A0A5S9PQG9_9GAMM|nr:16S rRNA (uracil(1498)-N(3))-methyltransferase [Zhongshania aliphaticivorans]CAA0106302.1 Ribosomal RNA small subunit methyltransferase E [Zhongshania aliphaticivorans]CAA0106479.1 Ribosomal RNA small subunit methyltransferase E [Zhongshania aliphaticivorans]
MRVPRIYVEQALAVNQELILDERAAHYVSQVLRMRTGRELILFNGDGSAYPASIVEVGKKLVQCQLGHETMAPCPVSPLNIELAIGISKGDRFDWVIQKATELGVNTITPLFTERGDVKLNGERLEKKQRHWQQVMISACEQSGRNDLVKIHQAQRLDEWNNTAHNAIKLVLCPSLHSPLTESNSTTSSAILLVGPEGGLSETEINSSIQQGFQPLQLGPRVLRTETAPIAAISIIQHRWGDMAWT